MLSAMTYMFIAATAAIQFGWKPLDGGGNEYIVQVEPELIDSFRKEGYVSDVPPELRDIRRIAIQVGAGSLPHQGEMTVLKPLLDGDVGMPHLAGPQTADARDSRATAQPPSIYDRNAMSAGSFAPPYRSQPEKSAPPPLLDPHGDTADNSPAPLINPAPRTVQRAAAFQDDSTSPSDADPAVRDNIFQGRAGSKMAVNRPVESTAPAVEPSKPWLLLVMVMGGLVASIAANVYLGWMHWETRRRYQSVVDQLHVAKV